MKKQHLIIYSAVLAALVSCSGEQHDGWTLEGTAPEGTTQVFLEEPSPLGGWRVVDSVAPEGLKYRFETPAAEGTIYRVSVGGDMVYVPAFGTETISLSADGIRSGSDEALIFNSVDSVLRAKGSTHELLKVLDGKYSTMGAYYATLMSTDPRVLKTVANRFNEERPDDALTAALLERVKRSDALRRKKNASQTEEQQVIYMPEIGYYDIELPDADNKPRKLSEVAENNNVTILAFSDFERPENAAVTIALGEARQAGAGIFEVGFDRNQHLWAIRSAELPWTNVFYSESAPRTIVSQYLVSELPTFFIISNGTITQRLNDPAAIKDALKNAK